MLTWTREVGRGTAGGADDGEGVVGGGSGDGVDPRNVGAVALGPEDGVARQRLQHLLRHGFRR